MPKRTSTNHELLRMALAGGEAEIARLDAVIAQLRVKLGKHGPGRPKAEVGGMAPTKRTMSAAGRRRIAAAQRKRWAAVKAKLAAPKKRKLSAAARHKMAVAARKRWAAQRKAKAKKTQPVAKSAGQKTVTAAGS